MNPDQDQDGGSLADRAAAWVPPWQRLIDPAPPTDAVEPSDDAAPGDPAEPIGDATPGDPVEPTGDASSGEPVVPGDSSAPVEPTDAVGPNDRADTDSDDPASAGLADEDVSDASDSLTTETDARDEDTAAAPVDDALPETVAPEGNNDVGTGSGDDAWTEADAIDPTTAEDPGEVHNADEPTETIDATADADTIDDAVVEAADNAQAHEQPMLPGLSGPELGGALEAILLVVDEPVTEAQLGDVLDVPAADVADRLAALAQEYADAGRGFELRRAAGGWRLYTRGEYSIYVERFVLDGQSARLTQAALETLAVIAYQQPVTRSRISAIRGVNCDGVVRTLVTRGLVEECGIQPESGAHLYRTTSLFLEKLGLDSVDELPPLAPFLPDDVNGLTDAR